MTNFDDDDDVITSSSCKQQQNSSDKENGQTTIKNNNNNNSKQAPAGSPCIIYLMALLSAMGGFLFGYDTGIVSGAMVFVRKVYNLNSVWQELVVSITILGAWVLSLMAGTLCERYGRKTMILYASIVFTIGSIIMGAAWGKWMLLFGRATVGVAIGIASTVVPMYIAELAPSNIRGSLVTMNNVFITIGQLSAAITAGVFSYDHENGWRWMLALAMVPALIQFFGFMFMPESPRWLVRHQRDDEALVALKQIRGEHDPSVQREFERMRHNQLELLVQDKRRKEQKRNIIVAIMRKTATRRALTVGCLLMAVQQLSGINTVMYYTATIIEMSGVQSQSAAVWLSVPTATVYVIFSLCGYVMADRVGRRCLTLGSLLGVILSLLLLGTGFHLTSLNGAAVTTYNMSTLEACYTKRDCASCISDSRCGFCYDSRTLAMAVCLEKNPDDPTHSRGGDCQAPPTLLQSSAAAGGVAGSTALGAGAGSIDNQDHHVLTSSALSSLTSSSSSSPSSDFVDELSQPSSFVFANHICPSMQQGIALNTWLVLTGLGMYLASFAPGMGPMPWTINSEIYPMWARSFCYSIATSVNWLFNLLISLTFISLTELITTHGAFYLYAVISAVCWLLLFWKLPETRGRSLEDISNLFAKTKEERDDEQDDQDIIEQDSTSGNQSMSVNGNNTTTQTLAGKPASYNQLAAVAAAAAAAASSAEASGKQTNHQLHHQLTHSTSMQNTPTTKTTTTTPPATGRNGMLAGHDNLAYSIEGVNNDNNNNSNSNNINNNMSGLIMQQQASSNYNNNEPIMGLNQANNSFNIERSKSFKLDNPLSRSPITAMSQPDLQQQQQQLHRHHHHQQQQKHQQQLQQSRYNPQYHHQQQQYPNNDQTPH